MPTIIYHNCDKATKNDPLYHILFCICLVILGGIFFIPDISTNRFYNLTTLWIEGMTGVTGLLFLVFRLSRISIPTLPFLLLTVAYILFAACNNGEWSWLLAMLMYFLILFHTLSTRKHAVLFIVVFLLLSAMFSACWGILQYIGYIPSYHNIFPITGPFDNPAGLACLLAVVFPITLYFSSAKESAIKILAVSTGVIILIAIFLSASRTALLSVIVITSLNYKKSIKWNAKRIIIAGAIIATTLSLLYLINPDSANGRILIWICSLSMVVDNFRTGIGIGNFQKGYMLSQADYFASHPDSTGALLADNIYHPFNEFLGLLAEQGILGFILLTCIIGYAVRQFLLYSGTEKRTILLCLLSLGICSSFSYPFSYPIFRLLLITLIAVMMSYGPVIQLGSLDWRAAICVAILSACIFLNALQKAYYDFQWKSASIEMAEKNLTDEDVQAFSLLYENSCLNKNADFLYNYALILYDTGKYAESNHILNICKEKVNDYDIQMLSGYGYLKTKNYLQAEKAFRTASYMIPGRLLPQLELMNLYTLTGNGKMATRMAEEIIKTPIKNNSQKVLFIRQKAEEYISNLKKGGNNENLKVQKN